MQVYCIIYNENAEKLEKDKKKKRNKHRTNRKQAARY